MRTSRFFFFISFIGSHLRPDEDYAAVGAGGGRGACTTHTKTERERFTDYDDFGAHSSCYGNVIAMARSADRLSHSAIVKANENIMDMHIRLFVFLSSDVCLSCQLEKSLWQN